MRLVRYGLPGEEKPGIIDGHEQIRDLSAHVADVNGATLSTESMAKLRRLDTNALPLVSGNPRFWRLRRGHW